jgi:Fe-S oxidoreductase/nitrate reductase gamma subunit
MPERVDFWGIPHSWRPDILVYSITGLAALILLVRFYRVARLWWAVGRPQPRWDKLPLRLGRLIQYAAVQTRVLSQRYPGIMHAGIAWGFFVFFLGTAFATIDSHFFKFLQGNIYLAYKFVLDIFTVFFFVGAALAVYRRFVQRPERLTMQPGFTWALILIVVIVAGGLITESLRLSIEQPEWALWSPAGWLLAQVWIGSGASNDTLSAWHAGVWLFHLSTVAILMATLPAGTLLHLITSPLNVFFSKTDLPKGSLRPVAQDPQTGPVYVSTLRDLTWKQLLDSDACTECGRCQDACPAFSAGTPLNPKQLMLDIRQALRRDGPALIGSGEHSPQLVGEQIKDTVLWSCTTCGACVQECPVLIEHVDAIVDMRRYLVLEGRMDGMLQDALSNLGRYGNSFGQSERARAKWTQPIQPKIKDARREPVDYLWFVGDYASYNAILAEISRKTAEVFHAAGIDFGLLYDSERNAGNDVRRAGEEGLFEMLRDKNAAVLAKCSFKAIVTTDPHSYNALKHEYDSAINGDRPILHSSELLDELLSSGRLKLSKQLGYKVTYHDPCYLGRYNDVYDAPRRVIEATGCELIEMPRNRKQTFCCGAGGGRIWMEEGEVKERPSEARIREAMGLNDVQVFVVACPKDVTMYQDALKTTGYEDRLVVKDLIELVHEAL